MSLVNLANVCSHLQNASKARLGLTSIPLTNLHLRLMLQLQRQGFLSQVTLGGPNPPLPRLVKDPMGRRRMIESQTIGPWMLYPEPSKQDAELLKERHQQTEQDVLGAQAAERAVADDEEVRLSDSPFAEDSIEDALLENEGDATGPPFSDDTESEPDPVEMRVVRGPSHYVPSNPAQRRLWLGLKYWNNDPVLSKMQMVSKPKKRIWLNSKDLGKISRGKEAGYVKGLARPGECLFVTTDRGIMETRECVERQIGGMVLCRVW